MPDRATIAVYNEKVEEYGQMAEPPEQLEALARFMAMLPANGHVLDLGCGPGKSAATLSKHEFIVDAIDASPAMVALANESFGINARVGSFNEICAQEIYDGVWANFSLLHASAEEFPGLLSAIHTALKPEGIFYLGMKTGKGSKRDSLGRFYTYYSEEVLTAHLSNNSFSIQTVQAGTGAGLAGTVDPWITILCVKA